MLTLWPAFSTGDFVKAGALMSYGPRYIERFRRAADYVGKVLRGTNPGDMATKRRRLPEMQECELGLEAEIAVHVFDELTLARNVARVSIELAFDLLRLPNRRPQAISGIRNYIRMLLLYCPCGLSVTPALSRA